MQKLRALSIRQPNAEAILRGLKEVEYRGRATRIRGTIYIYASLGRYSPADEADLMADYGITDCACDDLPRGVLVGTVELHNSTPDSEFDDHGWHLRNPQRLAELVKPIEKPQPVWFNPFGK